MFLLHVALEAPFVIQGLFAGPGLPVLDATNTTLVFVKVRAPGVGPCLGPWAVLVFADLLYFGGSCPWRMLRVGKKNTNTTSYTLRWRVAHV
jgi:hypothetical protein